MVGEIAVDPTDGYTMARGYGFASPQPWHNEDLRDSWPGEFFIPPTATFRIDVPNGNYRISVCLGSEDASSHTSIKAGLGRLMLDRVVTRPGQIVSRSFAFHVDDGQLKLAFGGPAPKVRRLEIVRDACIPTVFLAGDSPMTDQPSGGYPYCGWGQIRPIFHGCHSSDESCKIGESTKSFIEEGKMNKRWKTIRRGDYLFVQFAHNDEKDNSGGTKPYTTYQEYLRVYIDGARLRGAQPVLVSPMHRRSFDETGFIRDTHGAYIDAMRRVAVETRTPYLDLASKSKTLFERFSEEGTKRIFLWATPNEYPTLADGVQDNTHFSEFGAIEIAKLVIDCIRESGPIQLQACLRNG